MIAPTSSAGGRHDVHDPRVLELHAATFTFMASSWSPGPVLEAAQRVDRLAHAPTRPGGTMQARRLGEPDELSGGRDSPRVGCCQRTSASKPVMASPVREVDDRLVVQHPARSGSSARRSSLRRRQPLARLRRPCRARTASTWPLPRPLADVHREVGVAQQGVGVGRGADATRDADRPRWRGPAADARRPAPRTRRARGRPGPRRLARRPSTSSHEAPRTRRRRAGRRCRRRGSRPPAGGPRALQQHVAHRVAERRR